MLISTSEHVKKPSARKPLSQFSEVLDVTQKNNFLRLGAAKSKRKDIRTVNMYGYSIPKRRGNTKTNAHVKELFMIVFYIILRLCNHQ